jgi:hypothetical protein
VMFRGNPRYVVFVGLVSSGLLTATVFCSVFLHRLETVAV